MVRRGITPYSQAYVKSRSASATTENFAEATKLFLGGLTRDTAEYRQKYPKTWEAYKAIVEPIMVGTYTELKHKPKGDEWIL